jgi:hypothetical protein
MVTKFDIDKRCKALDLQVFMSTNDAAKQSLAARHINIGPPTINLAASLASSAGGLSRLFVFVFAHRHTTQAEIIFISTSVRFAGVSLAVQQ